MFRSVLFWSSRSSERETKYPTSLFDFKRKKHFALPQGIRLAKAKFLASNESLLLIDVVFAVLFASSLIVMMNDGEDEGAGKTSGL